MRSELRSVVRALGLAPDRSCDPARFARGDGADRVVAGWSGIGPEAAGRFAEQVVDRLAPRHVVVVGIAGGIGPTVAVGDPVVPTQVLDLDSGETFTPMPLGPHPRRGVLATSASLLESPEDARALMDRGVLAIDMETAAVARVCEGRGCPWSVFRAVSDRADDGSTDTGILALAGGGGRPDLAAVARFVLRSPGRIPQLFALARGARTAARVAARAAADALPR